MANHTHFLFFSLRLSRRAKKEKGKEQASNNNKKLKFQLEGISTFAVVVFVVVTAHITWGGGLNEIGIKTKENKEPTPAIPTATTKLNITNNWFWKMKNLFCSYQIQSKQTSKKRNFSEHYFIHLVHSAKLVFGLFIFCFAYCESCSCGWFFYSCCCSIVLNLKHILIKEYKLTIKEHFAIIVFVLINRICMWWCEEEKKKKQKIHIYKISSAIIKTTKKVYLHDIRVYIQHMCVHIQRGKEE